MRHWCASKVESEWVHVWMCVCVSVRTWKSLWSWNVERHEGTYSIIRTHRLNLRHRPSSTRWVPSRGHPKWSENTYAYSGLRQAAVADSSWHCDRTRSWLHWRKVMGPVRITSCMRNWMDAILACHQALSTEYICQTSVAIQSKPKSSYFLRWFMLLRSADDIAP